MNIPQMIAVIQIYIYWMKGVEVLIRPNMPKDLPKLLHAYTVANNWVEANLTLIKKV